MFRYPYRKKKKKTETFSKSMYNNKFKMNNKNKYKS